MSKIADHAAHLAEPLCKDLGIELWDAEFITEGGRQVLRLYIDKDGGVGIADCEAVSRALNPLLDADDGYDGAYVLEVSSPGMERTLKKPEHFVRYIGEQVDVRLFAPRDGKKSFAGTLVVRTDDAVTIRDDESEMTFANNEVSKVKLKPDYSKYF